MKIHLGRLIYIDIISVQMEEAIWKHIKICSFFNQNKVMSMGRKLVVVMYKCTLFSKTQIDEDRAVSKSFVCVNSS